MRLHHAIHSLRRLFSAPSTLALLAFALLSQPEIAQAALSASTIPTKRLLLIFPVIVIVVIIVLVRVTRHKK